MWNTAQTIAKPLQKFFEAEGMTFAIQDGPVAGQSVPHVHVHILPRRTGDFERNDQVYEELDKSKLSRKVTMDADKDRKPRSLNEMAQEAASLRPLYDASLPIPNDVELAPE